MPPPPVPMCASPSLPSPVDTVGVSAPSIASAAGNVALHPPLPLEARRMAFLHRLRATPQLDEPAQMPNVAAVPTESRGATSSEMASASGEERVLDTSLTDFEAAPVHGTSEASLLGIDTGQQNLYGSWDPAAMAPSHILTERQEAAVPEPSLALSASRDGVAPEPSLVLGALQEATVPEPSHLLTPKLSHVPNASQVAAAPEPSHIPDASRVAAAPEPSHLPDTSHLPDVSRVAAAPKPSHLSDAPWVTAAPEPSHLPDASRVAAAPEPSRLPDVSWVAAAPKPSHLPDASRVPAAPEPSRVPGVLRHFTVSGPSHDPEPSHELQDTTHIEQAHVLDAPRAADGSDSEKQMNMDSIQQDENVGSDAGSGGLPVMHVARAQYPDLHSGRHFTATYWGLLALDPSDHMGDLIERCTILMGIVLNFHADLAYIKDGLSKHRESDKRKKES
ncbi:hypothetical protein EDB83DRAFT_2530615 [Lactarius deliciosus]|nr:hypothetical protein EDB83DRAFT_2530615 [Lactarius deliciosus]